MVTIKQAIILFLQPLLPLTSTTNRASTVTARMMYLFYFMIIEAAVSTVTIISLTALELGIHRFEYTQGLRVSLFVVTEL
jgi:hypothetical protein